MSPRETAQAITLLAAGAGTLGGAAMLLTRVLRPTLETRRYAKDTHTALERTRSNLAALDGAGAMREHARAVRRETERIGLAT